MKSKILNGTSGLLKIICALLIGLTFSGLAIYDTYPAFPFMDVANANEIIDYMLVLLAFSAYLGMLVRGIMQIKSLFRADNTNKAVAFLIDILIIIFISAAYKTYFLYFTILGDTDNEVVAVIIYALSIVLMIIDAVVLCVNIKREKKKIFSEVNCTNAIGKVVRVVVPVMIIGMILVFDGMIEDNLARVKVNEKLSGNFASFTMSDFDGNEYTEDMFKGHKVNMINIWGTFCHPCIGEMPELEEISEMYDAKDFQLIGIPGDLYVSGGIDENKINEALNIIEITGVKYTILIPSGEIQAGVIDNGIRLYPTTIFVDEEGNQIKVVEGAMSKEKWIEIIEEVLAGEE